MDLLEKLWSGIKLSIVYLTRYIVKVNSNAEEIPHVNKN